MATVLVVDDEGDIRASLRGVLSDEGLRVLEAEDGRHALTLVRSERPELVLLDVWMPEVDGIELLRRLQEEPERPQVIMISGHGNIETAVQATKLGAFDFIEKPFSIDALLSVVGRALEQRALTADGAPRPAARPATNGHATPRVVPERTLGKSVIASGHGLHTGVKSGLILNPLPAGRGIVFAALTSGASVPAHLDYVDSTGYATTLHGGGMTVATVEHLLATLHCYGVTNALVKVQSEVPAMDGSALEFCKLIEQAGIEDQGGGIEPIVIEEPLRIGSADPEGEGISIEPADTFSVHYTLVYPPPVGRQEYTYEHRDGDSFRAEIAPARTFGFMRDMKALASMGLASGGRLDNFILIDDEKVVNTQLRFPDELARHKILDILGDLYLLGRPLRGRVLARKTGHTDNIALLRKIHERYGR
ncbi:MAG TPA: UDP-3-O-acyl-N-acetylglucosamine deacetylase [Candidatus Dormibacteraeota bacterium]|nr:UDP-3-O-acyl-N-acetylglucosamine deacetylase [Candidatus Dormibacteraeota bacterium]